MKANGLQEAVKTLVLKRKIGESIDVGGIIRITRTGVHTFAIQAPADIPIKRTELVNRDRNKPAA